MRLVLGFVKGAVAGGAAGGLAYLLRAEGILSFLLAGLAAALAGVVCGKPPWRHDTWVTPALKAVVGFGIGTALFYGWSRLHLEAAAARVAGPDLAPVFGPLVVGLLYGLFVEIDDGGEAKASSDGKPASGKRAP